MLSPTIGEIVVLVRSEVVLNPTVGDVVIVS